MNKKPAHQTQFIRFLLNSKLEPEIQNLKQHFQKKEIIKRSFKQGNSAIRSLTCLVFMKRIGDNNCMFLALSHTYFWLPDYNKKLEYRLHLIRQSIEKDFFAEQNNFKGYLKKLFRQNFVLHTNFGLLLVTFLYK